MNKSVCVNWNQYYNNCTPNGPNPFYDTTSFDNIGIAWIAIFQVRKVFENCQNGKYVISHDKRFTLGMVISFRQVITLEGWSDIMYFVQDAHSNWNWIYFVVLIVVREQYSN